VPILDEAKLLELLAGTIETASAMAEANGAMSRLA
jgi:hypothetical protein